MIFSSFSKSLSPEPPIDSTIILLNLSEIFEELLVVAQEQLSGKDLYVTDVFCGSSIASKRSVRFVSEIAWQSHFVKNMFIRPTPPELEIFKSDFVVLNACKAVNDKWKEHGLNSEVFVPPFELLSLSNLSRHLSVSL